MNQIHKHPTIPVSYLHINHGESVKVILHHSGCQTPVVLRVNFSGMPEILCNDLETTPFRIPKSSVESSEIDKKEEKELA